MSKNKEGGWLCSSCKEVFKTRKLLQEHHKICPLWLKRGGHNQFIRAKELGLPTPKAPNKGKPGTWRNRKHTEEQKKKISESMKLAHIEGRAHNIGECRWNNKPSYPEEWFIKMLKKEFNLELGKDYKREFPFHRYSLDFAWEDRKICVEIDGEQHKRFQEQAERDLKKDELLKEEGWIEIREEWKTIFNNPKEFIKKIKTVLGV